MHCWLAVSRNGRVPWVGLDAEGLWPVRKVMRRRMGARIAFVLASVLVVSCGRAKHDFVASWQGAGYCLARVVVNQLTGLDGTSIPLGITVPYLSARLSADGQHIAGPTLDSFVVVDRKSGVTRRLSEVRVNGDYEISPDASWLAWSGKYQNSHAQDLHVLSLTTGKHHVVSGSGRYLSWDPANRHLAFEDGNDVAVFDVSSGAVIRVPNAGHPSWRVLGELSMTSGVDLIIARVLSADASRTRLGDARPIRGHVRWSPDGEYAAFVTRSIGAQMSCLTSLSDASALSVMRFSDRRVVSLVSNCSAVDYSYHWVKDADLCRAFGQRRQ
jgi:hypothetical protein